MDYFITEYLFLVRRASFKSRHVKLSIYIFFMSVCQVFAEFQLILVTHFRGIFRETETTESAPVTWTRDNSFGDPNAGLY